MSPAPLSKLQFWLFTLGLFLVWTAVIVAGAPSNASSIAKGIVTAAVSEDKELKNTRNCKALCEHCGCLGFYCGEECICECNNENSDTECIATMQDNARKLAIPFEILIQGPTANRFVRNALQFEQNTDRKGVAPSAALKNSVAGRNKRSTVVIYKPAQQNDLLNQAVVLAESKKSVGSRHKRSVSQLDWFTDLTNTLVRPAPLNSRKSVTAARSEESTAAAVQQKRATNEFDRSWFADSASKLLQPSPIFKRYRSAEENYETPPAFAAAVEHIPRVLKDTLRSIQEAAITDDFADVLTRRIGKDDTEPNTDKLQQDFDFLSRNLRNDIASTISKLKIYRDESLAPTMAPVTLAPPPPQEQSPKYMMSWFRPGRFLQRVQQAIN